MSSLLHHPGDRRSRDVKEEEEEELLGGWRRWRWRRKVVKLALPMD